MEERQCIKRDNAVPPPVQLFEIATGFMRTQAVYAAAKLGIADQLKEGPRKVDELAEITGAQSNSLYRLLRALAGIGIFAENGDRKFELTPMASALLSDVPMSLRPCVLMFGDRSWWDSWGDLFGSVKTGEPAFDRIFGVDYTEYLEKHPDTAEIFNECMTNVSKVNNPAIVGSYDFSSFRKIVDVGGGHGSLLTVILKASPSVTGVLFDLPHVVRLVDGPDDELEGRYEIEGGDFFEEVPPGGDAYILKQIIHDWSDELSIKILLNCREAMNEKGRLLVIETVIEPGGAQAISKFFDLHMLVTSTGGKERTGPEYRSLFEAAGFELSKIIPTPSSFCIIEGYKK